MWTVKYGIFNEWQRIFQGGSGVPKGGDAIEIKHSYQDVHTYF